MKTPKTPRDHADEFLTLLDKAGFKPARWDSADTRLLDRPSPEGHPDRLALARAGLDMATRRTRYGALPAAFCWLAFRRLRKIIHIRSLQT